MNLKIITDLTKITLKFFVSLSYPFIDKQNSSYNIMCVLLDENNKIVKSNYICDKKNGSFNENLVSFIIGDDGEDIFYLNLVKMPKEVKYISFFLIGDSIGSTITGVDSVAFDFMDKTEKKSFATIELPFFCKDSKCINLCKIHRRNNDWLFNEICKPVKLDEFITFG